MAIVADQKTLGCAVTSAADGASASGTTNKPTFARTVKMAAPRAHVNSRPPVYSITITSVDADA